jgi:hypothetical protein
MPQEQVMPMIEQVMQQMQGAQQQGPPQENGETEGQPMMKSGGINNPGFKALPEKVQENIIRNMKDGGGIDNPGFRALPAEVQNKIVSNMQQGGEAEAMQQMVAQIGQALQEGANPQEVIAQLLQNTGDPEVVKQLMVAATGADEQTAMEQINPMVDQVAQQMQGGQGQGMSPQQQMMQQAMMNGGQMDEAMMGAINPTKDDFLKLKKKMLKEMKAGGSTKGLDSSSTEAYVQNLQGAISNHVAKNLRVGMINQQFDKVMKEFDSLPKAKGGADITDQMLIDQYNLSPESVDKFKTDPSYRQQFVTEYQKDFPEYADVATDNKDENSNIRSGTPGVKNPNTGKAMSWEELDAMGGWKGFTDLYGDPKYYAVDTKGDDPKHYYPGTNIESNRYNTSLSGKRVRTFDKSPLGQFFGSVNSTPTGEWTGSGKGEMAGMSPDEAEEYARNLIESGEATGNIRRGYLNKRGKLKKRAGLFGNRPQAVQFDYIRNATDAQVEEDNQADLVNEPPKPVTNVLGPPSDEIVVDQELVEIDEPNYNYTDTSDDGTPQQESATQQQNTTAPIITDEEGDYTPRMLELINEGKNPRKAKRMAQKEMAIQNPEIQGYDQAGVEERLSRKEQKLANDPYYGKTAQEIYQLVDDPKEAEKIIEKYGAQNQPLEMRSAMLPEKEIRDIRKDTYGGGSPYGKRAYYDFFESDEVKKRVFEDQSLDEIKADFQKNLFDDYGIAAPLYYPEYFKQHGGLVSNPGRPIWDFKQMKWNSPKPEQSLLFAQKGIAMEPEGSYRFETPMERTIDYGQIGQSIYEMGDWLQGAMMNARRRTTSDEAARQRALYATPIEAGSGSLGFYNPQTGDPVFSSTGAMGTGVLAGTGDNTTGGQGNQRNMYNEFTTGYRPEIFMGKYGMDVAQMGLQVGDEVDLSENEIAELAKYGYQITRM